MTFCMHIDFKFLTSLSPIAKREKQSLGPLQISCELLDAFRGFSF